MKEKKKWVMPEWMEKYRELFNNTGGNEIEELENDHTTTVFENAPRAMICVAIHCQVALLTALKKNGFLSEGESDV